MCSKELSVREGEAWITEEHLRIRSLLDQITSADNPLTLLPLLRDLRSQLSAHCDREEGDDGLHAIVSENVPEYRVRVDQLLTEHGPMLAEIDAVTGECSACIAGPLAKVNRLRDVMVKRIQGHDEAETKLLTDALTEAEAD